MHKDLMKDMLRAAWHELKATACGLKGATHICVGVDVAARLKITGMPERNIISHET